MTVEIVRNDGGTGELKKFVFKEDETIRELIERADLSFSSSDEVTTEDGTVVTLSDYVEDGEEYYIAPNYKNGSY